MIAASEAELNENKSEWKELWDETTLGLMWSMYDDNVCSQARKIYRHTEHRDALHVTIVKERDDLRQQKASLIASRYEQLQGRHHSSFVCVSQATAMPSWEEPLLRLGQVLWPKRR